jgi:hypothetical protein
MYLDNASGFCRSNIEAIDLNVFITSMVSSEYLSLAGIKGRVLSNSSDKTCILSAESNSA